jgi:hypothetical protein
MAYPSFDFVYCCAEPTHFPIRFCRRPLGRLIRHLSWKRIQLALQKAAGFNPTIQQALGEFHIFICIALSTF